MERIPRAIYTKELREEAVKLVTEGGLSIPEVGRRLSVSPSTIRYWVKANKEGKLKEAHKVFNRALSTGNDLVLFSEEYDVQTKEMLGDFPQGLMHFSLIGAAVALGDRNVPRSS
jgi:transposase-like protein